MTYYYIILHLYNTHLIHSLWNLKHISQSSCCTDVEHVEFIHLGIRDSVFIDQLL